MIKKLSVMAVLLFTLSACAAPALIAVGAALYNEKETVLNVGTGAYKLYNTAKEAKDSADVQDGSND